MKKIKLMLIVLLLATGATPCCWPMELEETEEFEDEYENDDEEEMEEREMG